MTKEIEEKVKEHAAMLQHEFIHGRMVNIKGIAENMAEFVFSLLTPSADVQEMAKEIWTRYVVNAPGPKDNPVIDSKMVIAAMVELAGASSVSGMQWVKASERTPTDYEGNVYHCKANGHNTCCTFDGTYFADMEYEYRGEDSVKWLDESGASSLQAENERLREENKSLKDNIDLAVDVLIRKGVLKGIPLSHNSLTKQ